MNQLKQLILRWLFKSHGLTKKCTRCHTTLPLDGYYRHTRGAYGRRAECKFCSKRLYPHHKNGSRRTCATIVGNGHRNRDNR